MVPAEVVLLDTLELVVAAADIDGEAGGEVLAAEPVALGSVLMVAAACEPEEVSKADGGDTGGAEYVEDDDKSGVDAVTEGELGAGAFDSIFAGWVELSERGNEVLGGRPDTRLGDCSAELVGAIVRGGDSTAELREEVFESRSLDRELVGEFFGDSELMELIKTLVGEAMVVVTEGELKRDTAGSAEPESVVFPP
jgi:hypothetical protein